MYCIFVFKADTWLNGRKYVSGFEDIEELHKYVFLHNLDYMHWTLFVEIDSLLQSYCWKASHHNFVKT